MCEHGDSILKLRHSFFCECYVYPCMLTVHGQRGKSTVHGKEEREGSKTNFRALELGINSLLPLRTLLHFYISHYIDFKRRPKIW